jgi:TPR repeat protein
VEDGHAWARVGGAEDASDDALLRSGMAAFQLASLASNGFATPLVPRDDAFAVHVLRQAMSAGDLGAEMALADRYFYGRGVTQNCTEGMRSVPHPLTPAFHMISMKCARDASSWGMHWMQRSISARSQGPEVCMYSLVEMWGVGWQSTRRSCYWMRPRQPEALGCSQLRRRCCGTG